jgi:hypothetical protein
MPLIVESGAIVAGAESYLSVAGADTYHANFGNTAWALLDTPTKEAALRKATAYLQQAYRFHWKGTRAGTAQALDWPRFGVYVEDVAFAGLPYYVGTSVVPTEVQQACAELALKASAAPLAPDLERATAMEKIGSIQVEYVAGAPQYTRYRAIDLMLRPYIDQSGVKLVRG